MPSLRSWGLVARPGTRGRSGPRIPVRGCVLPLSEPVGEASERETEDQGEEDGFL
jgi:hypothetical protein